MRMPSCVLPTGGSSEIASCISIAASAAASAVGNCDITSSPIVFITLPCALTVFSRMMPMHFSMAACATASPAVSYSFVLPLTSANSTAASFACSAIEPTRPPVIDADCTRQQKKRGAGAPLECCRDRLLAGHPFPALVQARRHRNSRLVETVVHRRRRADVACKSVFHLLRDAVRAECLVRFLHRRRRGASLHRRGYVLLQQLRSVRGEQGAIAGHR